MTQMVSAERAAALRNKCLNLAKTSIGFRSGELTDVVVATVDVCFWDLDLIIRLA